MKKIFLLVFFSLALTLLVGAQPMQTAPGMRDMTDIKNMSRILKRLGPAFDDQGVRNATAKAVQNRAVAIIEELKWTNGSSELQRGGYLVRVRTETSLVTNQSVVLGSPTFIGVGADPGSALTSSNATDFLEPLQSPNLKQEAHYFWLTLKPKSGKMTLNVSTISDSNSVTRIALLARTDKDFELGVLTAHKGWIARGVLDTLRSESQYRGEAASATRLLVEFQQRETRIAQLKSDLASAMRDEAAANRITKTLDSLGQILTLATLSLQVRAALPRMAEAEVEKATSIAQLKKNVEVHAASNKEEARRLGQEIIVIEEIHSGSRDDLDKSLDAVGLPRDLLNRIILH